MVQRVATNKGFTLIELLLVIGILGIMASIGIASFISTISKGKDSQRKNDIATLAKALDVYKSDWGEYPDVGTGNSIKGCMTFSGDALSDCASPITKFQYYRSGEAILLINKIPTDPAADRIYRYEYDPNFPDSFAIYAALENTSDRDVKKLANGDPDILNGWGPTKLCGSGGTALPLCNYKFTESGVVTQ